MFDLVQLVRIYREASIRRGSARLPGGMALLLEIVEGEGTGKQVSLDGPIEVGREASVTLRLDDEEVSRRHARIEPDGEGAVIHDLGSTNGSYVNDQPVGHSQRISPGDRIRLGLTVLELRSPEQVTRKPSAAGRAPRITQLDHGVLRPVPDDRLAPVETPGASVPGFMIEESEPAFVPRGVVEGDADGPEGAVQAGTQGYEAVARLIDTRIRRQTHVAAFAVLALAVLAVLVFFGAR